tara:strand:+ start:10493 stop:10789 length:297 start_codon:yes stop_codon:yes gene_type:complete
MIKLIEVYREKGFGGSSGFKMREIYINPNHVICMYDDLSMKKGLLEGLLPQDLDKRQLFTKLRLNQGQSLHQITVVGSTNIISEKLGLRADKRQILHD